MKKEVILAIIIGLLIGGVITFGMYRAKQAVELASPAPEFVPVVTPVPSENDSQTSHSQLIISEPEDESLSRTASVRVSGKTTPLATIVILQGDEENITTSDDQGNFSTTITVNPGGNILIIRSISSGGTNQEVIRTVVFSTSEFFDVPAVKTATSSTKKNTP